MRKRERAYFLDFLPHSFPSLIPFLPYFKLILCTIYSYCLLNFPIAPFISALLISPSSSSSSLFLSLLLTSCQYPHLKNDVLFLINITSFILLLLFRSLLMIFLSLTIFSTSFIYRSSSFSIFFLINPSCSSCFLLYYLLPIFLFLHSSGEFSLLLFSLIANRIPLLLFSH